MYVPIIQLVSIDYKERAFSASYKTVFFFCVENMGLYCKLRFTNVDGWSWRDIWLEQVNFRKALLTNFVGGKGRMKIGQMTSCQSPSLELTWACSACVCDADASVFYSAQFHAICNLISSLYALICSTCSRFPSLKKQAYK